MFVCVYVYTQMNIYMCVYICVCVCVCVSSHYIGQGSILGTQDPLLLLGFWTLGPNHPL